MTVENRWTLWVGRSHNGVPRHLLLFSELRNVFPKMLILQIIPMTDPSLDLGGKGGGRGGKGGFDSLALLAFLPSAISSSFTQN